MELAMGSSALVRRASPPGPHPTTTAAARATSILPRVMAFSPLDVRRDPSRRRDCHRAAGLFRFFLGIETDSLQGLHTLRRGVRPDQNHEAMRILADLGRGVTALSGKGMYTGSERSVLMCALTVTEVHNLKNAVAKEDPQAFVIVSPAQEILGRGFNPLEEE